LAHNTQKQDENECVETDEFIFRQSSLHWRTAQALEEPELPYIKYDIRRISMKKVHLRF
jgi:hypothetical protein